jgi:ribose transport system permease protein
VIETSAAKPDDGQVYAAHTHALPLRAIRALANSRELMLFVLVLALAIAMSVIYPHNFPTSSNARAVLLNAAQNGILVTGMMLLMIAGYFDLSIGSTLALAGVWSGVIVGWWGWPAEIGLLAGVFVGGAAGVINGLIVTRLGINALVATLATLAIFRGLTYVTAGTGVTPIGDDFKIYGQVVDPLLGLQSPFWVMLVIVLAFGWAIAKTRFFRQYFFIGATPRRRGSRAFASSD